MAKPLLASPDLPFFLPLDDPAMMLLYSEWLGERGDGRRVVMLLYARESWGIVDWCQYTLDEKTAIMHKAARTPPVNAANWLVPLGENQ